MRPTRFGPFGYPLSGEHRERPLVVCWILVMVTVLVPVAAPLTVVPVVGYLVRVIDASAAGSDAPTLGPTITGLLRRGVGGVVVAVGYLVGPLAALLVTVYGATANASGPDLGLSEGVVLYAGSTAVISLFLLAAYLVPVAAAAYARSGSLGAAFHTASLRPVAGHAAYFSRWMAGSVALTLASAVASVSLQIYRLGPVVASLLVVYGAVLACHVWGRGIALARER